MPKALPNILYDKTRATNIIDSPIAPYQLIMFKDEDYLSNYDNYVGFVKGIEHTVRNNDRYKKYINYLKKKIKLNKCQILKNVTDEDASIEMHHGPIFTLYDVCAIVLEYYIMKGWKISTFSVADTVLEEHMRNRVGVIMVSTTMHEEIHEKNIFIHYKQAWGDINAFTKKYADAMSDEYREQLNRYIDRCLLYDSNDFGILELNKALIKK
jgi:hypothetical protein|nr:MAG TPA: hypothetical protein [Caudoviricetes sp.]